MGFLSTVGTVAGGILGGPAGAAIGSVAGSALNSVFDNERSDRAADAVVGGSDRAQGIISGRLDEANAYLDPYYRSGLSAQNQRNALLGLPQEQFEAAPAPTDPDSPYQGPNYGAYLASRPDLVAYYQNNPSIQERFGTAEAYAEYQYETFGRPNGQVMPQFGDTPEAATPAAGPASAGGQPPMPGVVGIGGGAFTQGGDGDNVLAQIAPGVDVLGPVDPITQAQNDAYSAFENSGQARSMLETTQNDFSNIVGAMGAAGSSISGATLDAMNTRNRRNTNVAFNQYDNALMGIANGGRQAGSQIGSNVLNAGRDQARLEVGQGVARGSSYADRSSPWQEAMNTAAGEDWGKFGKEVGSYF